jgi:hypothetical protein
MKTTLLTLAVAAALAAVAGCDRAPEQRATPTPSTSSAAGGTTSAPQANTPSTPANAGTPSAAEKREGANPVQGQVDPKQGEQQKDFQQRGDGAGPKPGR